MTKEFCKRHFNNCKIIYKYESSGYFFSRYPVIQLFSVCSGRQSVTPVDEYSGQSIKHFKSAFMWLLYE